MSIHLYASAAESKVIILDQRQQYNIITQFHIVRQGVFVLNLFQYCTPFVSFTQFNSVYYFNIIHIDFGCQSQFYKSCIDQHIGFGCFCGILYGVYTV